RGVCDRAGACRGPTMIETKTSLTRLYRGARIAAATTALLVMLGCGDDKEVDPPAELTEITTTRDVRRVWTAGLGGDAERLRLALKPVIVEGTVYAASHDGVVAAMAANNGKRLWQVKTKLALSAGPEVGAGVIVLGSSDG